uniref:Uncharacterized protein n=1 Tax=Candidatus Kentrum sp. TC TaxID=2126339 RepID=A0A451ADH0_9GAMM|nr:MAG: hypothetical protein BECKTC1821D_GA0114238_10385 [Candidatus Kentron sp. TC]VFK64082.1 MAG: hypothetical protein BECKTC1821F_GA0114240_11143 [Candidatus Kentron sp. TC]
MDIRKIGLFIDFLALFSALVFSLIGKDIGEIIFKDVAYGYNGFPYITYSNIFILGSASAIIVYTHKIASMHLRSFICLGAALLSSLAVLFLSELASMMIFFCHILIFSLGIFSFLFRTYLEYEMKPEFWKIVFESLIKGIQVSIIIYVAMIAALRFVHEASGSYLGFSSTIFYPTVIYLYMLTMFGYWVVFPVWQKLIDQYKNE